MGWPRTGFPDLAGPYTERKRGASNSPKNTVAPAVSGTTTQGSTLTTTNGTWTNTPTGYAYQWYSGGLPVGANSSTYTLQAGDVGNLVRVLVTAANASGSNSATSAAVGPVTGGGGYTPALQFNDKRNSMYL